MESVFKESASKMIKPIDPSRCQAEIPTGASFMTLGGRPGLERCKSLPMYVAVESKSGPDGIKGAMSLCENCAKEFVKQMGTNYTVLFHRVDRPDYLKD